MLVRLAKSCSVALLVAVGVSGCVADSSSADADESNLQESTPIRHIASLVKSKLSNWSAADGQKLMRAHLARLRLIDASGEWAAPELSAAADELLPSDVDRTAVNAFVDRMAEAAEKNAYLATICGADGRKRLQGAR
jgi:hypothetical protein